MTAPDASRPVPEILAVRRRIRVIATVGNLFGVVLTRYYFEMIDPVVAQVPVPRWLDLAFFVVAVGLVVVASRRIGQRWFEPLYSPATADPALVRRHAILAPYAIAGITLMNWMAGGVIFGVIGPMLSGIFSWPVMLRLLLGIIGVAGTVATAFTFLYAEHEWRKILPRFFPDGDVSAVPDVLRLPVRARLRIVFALTSVIPLTVLGVLSLAKAGALVGADAAGAARLVQSMIVVIVFIVAVGLVAAAGLSLFVARSVSLPLRELERAMGDAARGDLDRRCPVVSNDEIGAVTEGFNRMLQGLRDRERIRETFGKYVTREIRDEILAGRVALEGQTCDVTIVFCDLRDFTPWVEATDPGEVVRDLNSYFTEMEEAIRTHGGLVLQYLGDEIEAVFGAPIAHPDHAVRAVEAAIDMRQRLAAWNAERERAGKKPLRHGIGIHTGTVLAGNIGSTERVSYALVGDAVNLASRIQGLNKEIGSDILVSGATRARLDGRFSLVELPAVNVKGKSAEIEVYKA